jgi:hypothetical protein
MDRYRSYGEKDDRPKEVGDGAFLGVDEYNAAENIRQGNVQKAVNHDFTAQDANTRGGFVCLPELGARPFRQVWTEQTSGTSTDLNAVAYGQGLWVAVGDSGMIRTSPDGVTWTVQSSPVTNNIRCITFGKGLFVAGLEWTAGSPYNLVKSSDGISWTAVSVTGGAFVIKDPIVSIATNRNNWVGTPSSANTDLFATSSNNGNTWGTSIVGPVPNNITAIAFINGQYVLTANATQSIWISRFFGTYEDVTPAGAGPMAYSAFIYPYLFAIGTTGQIYRSLDGTTWELVRASDGQTWKSMAAGDGVIVAVASSSGGDNIITSINGSEWITRYEIPNYAWNSVAFGNGQFVAVGDGGKIMTSVNVSPTVYASGLYSDPLEKDRPWIMVVGYDTVGFYAFGKASKTVSLGAYRVTEQSTIVQANNYVYLFRGDDETPLRWDGSWDNDFELVPNTTLPASFSSIPGSNQATFYQNRLWVREGKDSIAASDVLAFTDFDPQANEFNLNTGNSDYVVSTFPFGTNSLVVFKNKSILVLNNVEGSLLDVTATEVTRQVGLVGINAVTSIGPDLAYVSYGNINLLTLTSTNNALQHKTLPLSARIRKIMQRVNWNVGYKISLGYWSNRLYVALPLDASEFCNAVVVYNFITEQWFGEWNFNEDLNMCIQGWQVTDYLGLQRLHAITEDGRIFVTDEGPNDISGTTVAEISTELITRAYVVDEGNHFQRRIYLDLATNRPKFSCAAYTEGANEESVVVTDQTYSRAETWKWADSAYDLTNANNDYNRAYRKDYATGPDSIQAGTGFQPEMLQEFRLPLLVRRQGRLSWIKVTNTQGFISVMSLAFETRSGQRANFVQV